MPPAWDQFARMAVGDLRDMVLWEGRRLLEISRNRLVPRLVRGLPGGVRIESIKNKIVETFLGLCAILLANAAKLRLEPARSTRLIVAVARLLRTLRARQAVVGASSSRSGSMDSGGVTSQTTGSKASRFAFLRSFSTKGSQALLGQQNSLVSLRRRRVHQRRGDRYIHPLRRSAPRGDELCTEARGEYKRALPCLIMRNPVSFCGPKPTQRAGRAGKSIGRRLGQHR